jgi:putative ABC transport system ATP-binding protein
MTAQENVAVPLELAGRPNAATVAAKALAQVGLGHRLTHRPAQLSGGEQQRVALARAFAPAPRLLLADEPTGNLDVETGAMVMDLLFSLCTANGTTLVLITHDPALAARCDRTVTLRNGVIA